MTTIKTLDRQPSKLDYASPTQFKFQIAKLPKVEFFATAVNLPGISLSSIKQQTPLADIPLPGEKITFQDLELTFLVDEKISFEGRNVISVPELFDFPISQCRGLVATHADVDHIQGLAKAKSILKAPVFAHPKAVESLEQGDRIKTFAEISAQNVHLEMPVVKIEKTIVDGDKIKVGNRELEVWHTPGHTDSQLAFRFGNLLLSGDAPPDNILFLFLHILLDFLFLVKVILLL